MVRMGEETQETRDGGQGVVILLLFVLLLSLHLLFIVMDWKDDNRNDRYVKKNEGSRMFVQAGQEAVLGGDAIH